MRVLLQFLSKHFDVKRLKGIFVVVSSSPEI